MLTNLKRDNGRSCKNCKSRSKRHGGFGLCKPCYDTFDYYRDPKYHMDQMRKWRKKHQENHRKNSKKSHRIWYKKHRIRILAQEKRRRSLSKKLWNRLTQSTASFLLFSPYPPLSLSLGTTPIQIPTSNERTTSWSGIELTKNYYLTIVCVGKRKYHRSHLPQQLQISNLICHPQKLCRWKTDTH